MRAALVLAALLLGPVLGARAEATPRLDLDTTVDADGAYRSVGRMVLPFPVEQVARVMTDFDHYDAWAPRGQDGKDPGSAGYIGQLIGVRAGPGTLDLIYRINLLWPFGSSGKSITLATEVPPGPAGKTSVKFTLKKPSFVTPIVEGVFSLSEAGPGQSQIQLDCRMKLAWFLMPFFPLEAYKVHVAKRLETAMRSFAADLSSP